MIFNDVVEWSNVVCKKIDELSKFEKAIVDILNEYDRKNKDNFVEQIKNDNLNRNRDATIELLQFISRESKLINLMRIGIIIGDIERQQLLNDKIGKPYIDVVNSVTKCCDDIYAYINSGSLTEMACMIDIIIGSMRESVNAIKIFKDFNTYINSINIDLSQGVEVAPLQIRFLNEGNTVSNLLDNINLIKDVYNDVNELIGDGEELKYCRVESGTFEITLVGCVTALLMIRPLLEFSYKVYSEQFSPKAKLELEEKKIKVRGEYLKLLKEETESKEITGFNIKEEQRIQTLIGNLDINIKELYCKNPFIKVNNKNLGLEEMKDKKVSIKLLKSEEDTELNIMDNTVK